VADAPHETNIKAGARGFLLKGAAPDQLFQAIHAAVDGDALIDPGVTARLLESFSSSEPTSTPVRPIAAPTEREEHVLLHVARGLTNAEMAALTREHNGLASGWGEH